MIQKKEKKEENTDIIIERKKKKKTKKKKIYLDTLVIALILENHTKNSNIIKLIRDKGDRPPEELKQFKKVEINSFKVWD